MIAVIAVLVVFASIIWQSFQTWEEEFGSKRVMRSNAASVSHGDPPSLKTFAQNKDHVIVSSMKHEENFGDVEGTYLPDAIVDESDKKSW
jgi:hypothetical protein